MNYMPVHIYCTLEWLDDPSVITAWLMIVRFLRLSHIIPLGYSSAP